MRSDIDYVIHHLDHIRIVLDDQHRVAFVAQLLQKLVKAMHVAGMKGDARLVEDLTHLHQAAAEVFHYLEPNVCEYKLRQIPPHRQRGRGQHLQRR